MKYIMRITLTALVCMALSCSTVIDSSLPLSFSYQLLDVNGKVSTVFKKGDPITFRFQVTNSSTEVIYLSNFFADFCDGNSNFFRVVGSADGSERRIDYGRACFPMICTMTGAIGISSQTPYVIQYNWLSDSPECSAKNTALPAGHYVTEFTQKFSGNGGTYDRASTQQNFKVEFDVK